MSQTIVPIKASTQEHLDILDIQDDLVINKDGSCNLILQITAINYSLLSEEEQDAIIFAYAGLLNSLTFPIQIIIHSKIKDVTDYVNLIKKQEHKQKNPLLLKQLIKYREFIENTIQENQVLDKKFYVSVPFSKYELGISPNTINLKSQKTQKLPYPKSYILEKAKMSLYPKRDHLISQFARIGLKAYQLNTQALLELFYSQYNQESQGQKFAQVKDYRSPIVQAKPNIRPTNSNSPNITNNKTSMTSLTPVTQLPINQNRK